MSKLVDKVSLAGGVLGGLETPSVGVFAEFEIIVGSL